MRVELHSGEALTQRVAKHHHRHHENIPAHTQPEERKHHDRRNRTHCHDRHDQICRDTRCQHLLRFGHNIHDFSASTPVAAIALHTPVVTTTAAATVAHSTAAPGTTNTFYTTAALRYNHAASPLAGSDELHAVANAHERPSKRVKLSVRAKSASGTPDSATAANANKLATTSGAATATQTTLDRYNFGQHTVTRVPLAPAHDIRHHSPPPALVNGALAATTAATVSAAKHEGSEDELQKPTAMPARTSRRTTRSPQRARSRSRPRSTASDPRSRQSQSQPPQKPEDKRTLRSQDDGPRLKSELATYFPAYEDIMFDVPRDAELLTVDSTLLITDKPPPASAMDISPSKSSKAIKSSPGHRHGRGASANGVNTPLTPSRPSIHQQFNGSPSLNLEMIAKSVPAETEDPLSDAHFFKSHRRAERKEKQLRNIERERAMHEKVQLDRLLAGLRGHDWLRVLGVTGVTDGESRRYEAKRDFFIAEVQALVDKFKLWKEQERKQKLDKEAAAEAIAAAAREAEDEDDSSREGSVDPPSSDLNASAARQLQQEAANALKAASNKLPKPKPAGGRASLSSLAARQRPSALLRTPAGSIRAGVDTAPHSAPPLLALPPSPEHPITSFYAKRHLRDAALGKSRHAGRNATAFGHPVPELVGGPPGFAEWREFELPAEYITPDALRASARERRRRNRRGRSPDGGKAGPTPSELTPVRRRRRGRGVSTGGEAQDTSTLPDEVVMSSAPAAEIPDSETGVEDGDVAM